MIYDETILTELFSLKADNFDNQVEGVAKISVLLFIILCLFYSVKTSIKIYLVLIFVFVSVYYTVLINQNNKILLKENYNEIYETIEKNNERIKTNTVPQYHCNREHNFNLYDAPTPTPTIIKNINRKTDMIPQIATPIYDFESWQPSDFIPPTAINKQNIFDEHSSGYKTSNNLVEESPVFLPPFTETSPEKYNKKSILNDVYDQYEMLTPSLQHEIDHKKSYSTYIEPVTGQPRFNYDKVEFGKNSYLSKNKVDFVNENTLEGSNLYQYSDNAYLISSLNQRTELQNRLNRQNSGKYYQQKIAPIRTNVHTRGSMSSSVSNYNGPRGGMLN